MDYSALTEAQQQQYQQYQAQVQQHQQQSQDQQQPYDPAQAQAYEAYYAYHQQQYEASASASASQHQYAAYQQQYYPHDYAAYQHQQQQQPMAQPDSSTSHAAPPDTAQAHQQQGSGAASGHGYPQQHQGSYQAPSGLNPAAAAAVAALSQLTQFAGTMDAAERAMAGLHDRHGHPKSGGMTMGGGQHHPPPHHHYGAVAMHPGVGGRSPYRGGGRRGGGPFRGGGGGRGNFGHHPPRPDGGSPHFRGRGRGGRMGRGAGKRFHHESQSPYRAPETLAAPTQMSAVAPTGAPVPPRRPLPPLAWCDICRVDCNSLEILEQHKNGKRHKKTVQRFEEIQAQQKILTESQDRYTMQRSKETESQPKIVAESQTKVDGQPRSEETQSQQKSVAESQSHVDGQPEMVVQEFEEHNALQEGEENKVSASSENLEDASLMNENKMETEQRSQTDSEPSESFKVEAMTMAPLTRRARMDGYDRRYPPKRKMMRFGRVGKRLKNFEPVRSRPPERPKEQPRVCTLCNVMCDTQAVFECHLTGKKHTSKIKRFQGHGVVYGPLTVYIPPNQPSVTPQSVEPLFYGLQTPEMMQQATYMHEGLAVESYGDQAAMADEQAVLEPQTEQDGEQPQTEQDGEPRGQEISATEGWLAVTLEPECQNAVSESEGNEGRVAVEVPISENPIMETESSFTTKEDDVPAPEYGVLSADNIILPGLYIKVEETGADNGELDNQDASLQ